MLLKAGANPNLQLKLFPPYRSLRDDRGADTLLTVGTTPLLRAAKAVDVPAIKLLLAAGANVDLPTVNGVTLLLAAAGVGSGGLDTRGRYRDEAAATEAVKLLLDAGADVRARDKSGNTALHAAAGAGWNTVVSLLAARNADLFCKGWSRQDRGRSHQGRSGRGRPFRRHPGPARDRSTAAQADGRCAGRRRDAVSHEKTGIPRRHHARDAGAQPPGARHCPAQPMRLSSVTQLGERLWQIAGAGGNVTVFGSSEGVLLVDGGAVATHEAPARRGAAAHRHRARCTPCSIRTGTTTRPDPTRYWARPARASWRTKTRACG